MSKFTNHYSVLGIDENATGIEINIAYKRQCFKWHPDRNPRVEATNKMQEINEAKRILADERLREAYNKEHQSYKEKLANQNKNKSENSKCENAVPKTNYSFNLKTDSELISACANAAKYKFEYIHAVLQELKRRDYSLDTIIGIIKRKRTHPHR